MHKRIAEIKEKYKKATSGLEAKYQINELAEVCRKITARREKIPYEELGNITVVLWTEDEVEMVMRFPPVTMALHYRMYQQAELMLNAIQGPVTVYAFTGEIVRKYASSQDYCDYPDITNCITIGEILVADPDIPKSFMELLNNKVDKSDKNGALICFSSDVVTNDYITYFYKQDFVGGWSYNILTKGLKALYSKCPELLKGMMDWQLIHTGVPKVPSAYTPEEGQRLLNEYIRFISTVIDCTCKTGGDIELFFAALYGIEVARDEDYITYEAEYRKYIKLLISKKDLIVQNMKNGRLRYAQFLLKEDAANYFVWTCRYRKYDKRVRCAAKRIGEGLGSTARELIGENYYEFLNNADEVIDLYGLLQILTLLKYSCGYEMKTDLTDSEAALSITKHFQQIEWDKGKNNEISIAVEVLEFMDEFSNSQEATEISKKIADIIICSKNEELLEVSLRKKLIPECLYGYISEEACSRAPALLPCIIAYKTGSNNGSRRE